MVSREYLKQEIDSLPDEALEDIGKYIVLQKFFLGVFKNDTEYLTAVPGMAEKIIKGMNEPLSQCLSEDEVGW